MSTKIKGDDAVRGGAGLRIDALGGYCPVQADGTFDGVPFYFRSRGDGWSLGVGAQPVDVSMGWEVGFRRYGDYGVWPEAGYMDEAEVRRIVRQCYAEWCAERAKAATAPSSPAMCSSEDQSHE